MNKLYIESVKASNDITPLDVYFILKVGEHCHFSNIITIQQQQQLQQCNLCVSFQPRDKQLMTLECWAYDQHVVTKSFFGKETISNSTKRVMFDGLEIWIKQSQQERSRTPEVAMKRDASPFGRRDLTPKREKK